MDDCHPDPNQWVIYLGSNGTSTYGVVQLKRNPDEYDKYSTCSLKLVPPAGYTLHIVIDWVHVSPEPPDACILTYGYLEISGENFASKICAVA